MNGVRDGGETEADFEVGPLALSAGGLHRVGLGVGAIGLRGLVVVPVGLGLDLDLVPHTLRRGTKITAGRELRQITMSVDQGRWGLGSWTGVSARSPG
jgi:hypothetical protein